MPDSTLPGVRNAPRRQTPRAAMWLVLAWTALLPLQVPLTFAEGGGRPLNFAPSDGVLVVAVLLLGGHLALRSQMWSGWHFALPILLASSIVFGGALTRYSLANKLIGMLVLLGAYLMLTSFVRTRRDVSSVITVFVASVVILNAVAVTAYLAAIDIPLQLCHAKDVACLRLAGFMPDSNLYGSVLVVALAMLLALSGTPALRFPEVLRGRLAQLLMTGSLFLGLAMTLSRSAWMALAVVLLGLLAIRPQRGVALGLVIVVAALLSMLAAPEDLVTTSLRTTTIFSRVELMEFGADAFMENPAFGIGLGNFPERHGQIIHNTPLWFGAEMGLVGLVVFLGFAWWVLRRAWTTYRDSVGQARLVAGALVVGNLAMAVFSVAVEALYQRHWWLLIALAVVGSSLGDGAPAAATAARSPGTAGLRPGSGR